MSEDPLTAPPMFDIAPPRFSFRRTATLAIATVIGVPVACAVLLQPRGRHFWGGLGAAAVAFVVMCAFVFASFTLAERYSRRWNAKRTRSTLALRPGAVHAAFASTSALTVIGLSRHGASGSVFLADRLVSFVPQNSEEHARQVRWSEVERVTFRPRFAILGRLAVQTTDGRSAAWIIRDDCTTFYQVLSTIDPDKPA